MSDSVQQYQLNLKLNDYRFTPRLIPAIATLVMLPTLLWLGFWQLDRAEQKRLIISGFHTHAHEQPMLLSKINQSKEKLRYRMLQVSGRFDNKHQFLVDNKFDNHKIGYHVITPFRPNGSNKVLLINRGWIPMGKNRNTLPTIKAVTKTLTLEGQIEYPSKKGLVLGNNIETSKSWPLRIQKLETAPMALALKKDLYPFFVLLGPKQSHGFVRQWQPVVMGPEKHLAYAFQWFALALTVLILFFAVNIHRRRQHDH